VVALELYPGLLACPNHLDRQPQPRSETSKGASVSEIVITYAGPMPQHAGQPPVTDVHNFVPCFQAERGDELVLKVWIELSGYAATIASNQLTRIGLSASEAEQALNDALIRYGVKRLEATMRDLASRFGEKKGTGGTWQLTADDVPQLLALAGDKSCAYQARVRRDLFCLASAPEDKTAGGVIDGRRAAPTSRPLCRACSLPSTDYICSHLMHPGVVGVATDQGIVRRQVSDVMCDRDRDEIHQVHGCHAGGHGCWQRLCDARVPAK
jgi:hypothetical protein